MVAHPFGLTQGSAAPPLLEAMRERDALGSMPDFTSMPMAHVERHLITLEAEDDVLEDLDAAGLEMRLPGETAEARERRLADWQNRLGAIMQVAATLEDTRFVNEHMMLDLRGSRKAQLVDLVYALSGERVGHLKAPERVRAVRGPVPPTAGARKEQQPAPWRTYEAARRASSRRCARRSPTRWSGACSGSRAPPPGPPPRPPSRPLPSGVLTSRNYAGDPLSASRPKGYGVTTERWERQERGGVRFLT